MTPRRSALISGASIAGPATAYWLQQHGWAATVVERSSTVRPGGYPIDIRGTAMEAGTRMGMRDDLLAAHIRQRRLTFVDPEGGVVGSIRPESITGGIEGRDVEIPRGALTDLLWQRTRDTVEYVFDDSIAAIDDGGDGVDVTFQSGAQRRFDIVIGADGLHSNVRRLVFGPHDDYERYLGKYFVGFMSPNFLGISREGRILSTTPGRNCIQYAVGDDPESVHAFFSFTCPDPPALATRELDPQRQIFQDRFGDLGWIVPQMLEAMWADDDAFFDTVSQVHMPTWSKGRVTLVGDAGYAASFLSGQGSSLAMVGGYVLGNELGTNPDHRQALATYEQIMRPFVAANQALANPKKAKTTVDSAWQQRIRNLTFKVVFPAIDRLGLGRFLGGEARKATTAIALPDYPQAVGPTT